MPAFVCAERMARATGGGQTRKAGVASATIFARVFRFFSALIQSVFAFVRASGVAETGCRRQAGDAGGFGSAVLAVVFMDERWVMGLNLLKRLVFS